MVAAGSLAMVASSAGAAKDGLNSPYPPGEDCVIVLDELRPGEETSRVVFQKCSTDRTELAPSAWSESAGIQASWRLMTWFSDWGTGGDSTEIYGTAGPCDASGYGISYVGNAWNDRIHSWNLDSLCWRVTAYQHAGYKGSSFYYPGPFWGPSWIGISSMRVRR
jgi:hypothetical protein